MGILCEGQEIRDTYTVERFLGEGAFAEVYRVKHRFLGRQAMKVFKTPGMTLQEIEEMLGEAVLLSKLGHPNIVRVYDANLMEVNDEILGYFTMENITGGSLFQYWQKSDPLPVDEVVSLSIDICRGLSIAHAANPPIVHRDIKPQNVLVSCQTDTPTAKVSDFGLAKSVNPLTLMASGKGTMAYKPPEVFLDFHNDSCAGDVWAIGCTLYLLLTDLFPFPHVGENGVVHYQDFLKKITPPSGINWYVDIDLERIVFRCLEVNPENRYSHAAQLLNELETWQGRKGSKECEESRTEMDLSQLVRTAFSIAQDPHRLQQAADLMEQAVCQSEALRDQYAYLIVLWRKGITG
jgi:eukaryotic-like serine/threonine-protein kinase